MKYQRHDLTARFRNHPLYDGHAVLGMMKADGSIAATIGQHRIGTGVTDRRTGTLLKNGGGIRKWRGYGSDAVAAVDTLKMPTAMSQKFAGLDLPIGGAKTIIYGHNVPEIFESAEAMNEFWRAFGQEILPHVPHYLAAEDVGTTPEDMRYLAQYAPPGRIAGCSQETNPSPRTARGCVIGIEAATQFFGLPFATKLADSSYAIQGLGSVGAAILEMLWNAGARDITVADIVEARVEQALARYPGIRRDKPSDIHLADADVFVPCALGGVLSVESVSAMVQGISPFAIAGCANNQLATPDAGNLLHEHGVLYAPDYIINAGGAAEIITELTGADIETMLRGIGTTLTHIFEVSDADDRPTWRVADELVAGRVAQMALPC